MIRRLYQICEALEKSYPGPRHPYRILAWLMEESGELAKPIHLRDAIGRNYENGR